jgi:hypothetical protein
MSEHKSDLTGQRNVEFTLVQKLIAVLVSIVLVPLALYYITLTVMNMINHKIAISDGYTYANLFQPGDYSFNIMALMFFFTYFAFTLATVLSWIKRDNLKKSLFMTTISLIPAVFFVYNYQNTDEYMYQPISELYEKLVLANPTFSKSDIGLQFSKALTTHDYASLKKITNDMDSIKKMDFKWNSKIGEVINLLPLPKSVEAFKAMTSDNTRFISVSDYKHFYDNLLIEFKASDIASKKEFIYLIESINPDRYYSQLP